MECVLLLLHALNAFQNVLLLHVYMHMQITAGIVDPTLYCKLRNACTYVCGTET